MYDQVHAASCLFNLDINTGHPRVIYHLYSNMLLFWVYDFPRLIELIN